jgi:protein lifeguard
MPRTTKYSPAPQQDPDNETARYTAPPPSYEATASSSRDQETLLGGPRSSEDNIPDDFKVMKFI